MADLAVLLQNWHDPENPMPQGDAVTTAMDGWISQEEIAGSYAEQMGVSLDRLDYYRAFATWRLACIIEGVYARYINGQQGEQDEEVALDEYRIFVEAGAGYAASLLGL